MNLQKCLFTLFIICVYQTSIAQENPFAMHRNSLRKRFGLRADSYESHANIITAELGGGYIGGFPAIKQSLQLEHYIAANRRWSYTINVGHFTATRMGYKRLSIPDIHVELSTNYIAPGFALHIKTGKKIIDPSFGIAFPLGRMIRTERYDSTQFSTSLNTQSFFGAVCGNFSLTALSKKHFVLGCVLNAGLIYKDAPTGSISSKKDNAFLSIGYKMGWRFGKKIGW